MSQTLAITLVTMLHKRCDSKVNMIAVLVVVVRVVIVHVDVKYQRMSCNAFISLSYDFTQLLNVCCCQVYTLRCSCCCCCNAHCNKSEILLYLLVI